ncbi:MAG TPA: acyl-CoA thioesterase II [Planosporangium sp.]|nr:acyl-CoA thioesterase II [Planosporangium sp.]
MTTAAAGLLDALALEQTAADAFLAISVPGPRDRVFGGQVAAQSLAAAGRTVSPGRRPHSLHTHFLRPGDPRTPIRYDVERVRDGGSFSTRGVVASQRDRQICQVTVSFHVSEDGVEHQARMPEVPAPYGLAARPVPFPQPFDIRDVPGRRDTPANSVWMRHTDPVPDDELLQACLFTYASDLSLFEPVLRAHGVRWTDPTLQSATLDHVVWFHRPFRVDEWFLYDHDSPNAAAGRALAIGRVFRRDGLLVASVAQEGLIRVRREDPRGGR